MNEQLSNFMQELERMQRRAKLQEMFRNMGLLPPSIDERKKLFFVAQDAGLIPSVRSDNPFRFDQWERLRRELFIR
ncbi:MAG: hypothetical protein Q8O92_07475 [Candidatus Latescibacter sp.]|nr:hypothetical protein [Candidatus Latescibacter sp.]